MRTRSDLTRRDLRVAGSPPRRGTGWHWCSAKYGRGRASRLREPRLALVLLRRCVRLRASRARWAPLVHAFDSRRLHQFSPLKNHDLSNDSALRPASEWGTRQHRAHGMLSPCPYPWLWIRRVSLTAAWAHAGLCRATKRVALERSSERIGPGRAIQDHTGPEPNRSSIPAPSTNSLL